MQWFAQCWNAICCCIPGQQQHNEDNPESYQPLLNEDRSNQQNPTTIESIQCSFCQQKVQNKLSCGCYCCIQCFRNIALQQYKSHPEFVILTCPVHRIYLEHYQQLIDEDQVLTQKIQQLMALKSCIICYESIQDQSVLACHQVCKKCLEQYISDKIGKGQIMVICCPACSKVISYNTIRQLVEKNVFYNYDNQLKLKALNDKICIECQECHYFLFGLPSCERVFCPKCEQPICIQCGQQHDSEECSYEEIQGVSRCPKCGEGVIKEQGCNFITCPSQKCAEQTFFCWICKDLLQKEDHIKHYRRFGPFGDTCNTIDQRMIEPIEV